MRTSLLVLLTCSALAAIPSVALAKGITGVEVCGADGCSAVDPAFFHAAMAEGDPFLAPVAAAPFVTVRVKHGEYRGGAPIRAHSERFTYVPSLGLVRPQGATQWIELYPVRRRELDKIVAPVRPLPAARLRGVGAPPQAASPGGGTPWSLIGGACAAALLLLVLLGRYALAAVRARPRPVS
jgi:hypothetical protein